MKKIVKDALILFAITLIAGVLLGFVHELTKEPIAKAQADAANATYRAIFAEADSFEESPDLTEVAVACTADETLQAFGSNVSVNNILYAKDESGEDIGYVIISSAKGYGGPVKIAVGVNADGVITGLGFITINETPGLGMKAKDDSFTSQFAGMTDPDTMDAVSGATYTTKAVRAGVKAALYCLENYL